MNIKDLKKIKNAYAQEMKLRKGDANSFNIKYEVVVCGGTGCRSCKSKEIQNYFIEKVNKENLQNEVKVLGVGCFGMCAEGPIAVVYPEGTLYAHVNKNAVDKIVENHLKNGKVQEDFLLKNQDGTKAFTKQEYDFCKNQLLIARKNAEYLSLENPLYDYIALEGYFALHKALHEKTPDEVIKEIEDSGLKGRGGAGFSTGKKWALAKQSKGKTKYFCCNADEGDPGAFMDRSIIEGNPHAIIEAMIIGGYAIGAHHGVVYLRAEYPLAGQRLENAIKDAKKHGLLGKNILESGFNFDLQIKYGAGAFVCGEETALIKSVEGKRGEPNIKPPYPAESGLYSCPTIINNVETLANVPQIILNGSKWCKKIGTKTSTGTKVFALTGKVKNAGLIELPMGTTIGDIVFNIGGGIKNNRTFKAVQMGGPSGGCIPASLKSAKIDYESLKSMGSMMGSGGMIVMDEDTCMVDIAKYFLEFSVDESCGKCTPCRIGNKKMLDILTKICEGRGTLTDLDELETLAKYVQENSLCGLGQCSPNPVLSTLKYFKDEYIEHIENKRCPACVCKNLTQYEIDREKCKGCSLCAKRCPVMAIRGEIKSPFEIDPKICIKCGLCFNSCKFNAIRRK